MNRIRVGIVGYGNLGKGVELALRQNPDMELAAVITRRNPDSIRPLTKNVPVCGYTQLRALSGKIDVMILCGGSAVDLIVQAPEVAALFHTVDSFDTHARIPEYFSVVDRAAQSSGHLSIISVGWDPGMFSINRLYNNCILPKGSDYTFWGAGVSQGHSDAIRRVPGVKDAKQYTLPVEKAVEKVRHGDAPKLSTREKHTRLCYVVAEEGADLAGIERTIQTMPNYFADYDTTVKFISEEDFRREHSEMPHGGFVIRCGATGENGARKQLIEYSLKLDSNPEFTACILVAYARAAHRLARNAVSGAKTVFDIAPAMLSPLTSAELMAQFL